MEREGERESGFAVSLKDIELKGDWPADSTVGRVRISKGDTSTSSQRPTLIFLSPLPFHNEAEIPPELD